MGNQGKGTGRGGAAGYALVNAAAACKHILLTALLLLLLTPALQAQDRRVVLNEGKLWRYAQSLFDRGEYYRAVSEYWRLLHFFPQGARDADARLRIGQALLWGGEPAQALRHFESTAEAPSLAERGDDLRYLRGLSRLELEPERPYPLREQTIGHALADLRAIDPAWRGSGQVGGFLKAMEEPPELPEKSPGFAGALSAVLPGSGSFYVGRYAEGSLAFFITALFIAASVEAFEDDREGAGLVLGSLGLAFYGGSILAAISGAHKFNDGTKAAYLAQQRRKFGIVIDRTGLAGAFRTTY